MSRAAYWQDRAEDALGRTEDAVQAFINAAAADVDGVTDAEERLTELT